jgi:hypothetical protein
MGNLILTLKYQYQCCNSLLDEEVDDSPPVIIDQLPVHQDPLQSVGSFVTVIGQRPNNNNN